MTQMMNFKKVEVVGSTKEEALKKAPFELMRDATAAYRNFLKKQVNGVTEADKKQFMIDYLMKWTGGASGLGCYITLDPAVANTRENPYKFVNVGNRKGARKRIKIYQIIDSDNNTILAETKPKLVQKTVKGKPVTNADGSPVMIWKGGTKTQAKNLAKDLYVTGVFKGNLVCKISSKVVEGEETAFEMSYVPSKNTRVGTYLLFGVEVN